MGGQNARLRLCEARAKNRANFSKRRGHREGVDVLRNIDTLAARLELGRARRRLGRRTEAALTDGLGGVDERVVLRHLPQRQNGQEEEKQETGEPPHWAPTVSRKRMPRILPNTLPLRRNKWTNYRAHPRTISQLDCACDLGLAHLSASTKQSSEWWRDAPSRCSIVVPEIHRIRDPSPRVRDGGRARVGGLNRVSGCAQRCRSGRTWRRSTMTSSTNRSWCKYSTTRPLARRQSGSRR